ncbi:MAG: Gfo/Idh/MocA family oxidoreductase [Planctomycetota bacterium]|nr:Gfo/Idh/MocA family oxidoreductase [Planctomycetota bacterium]
MQESDRRTFLAQVAGAAAVVSLFPSVLPAALRPSAPISVGVVGIGRQGRRLLGELQKFQGEGTVRVAAICDVSKQRLDGGLRNTQNAEPFEDYRAMLDKAKDLQAIIIATPTHLHKDIAVAALAAGKHVYCEMPMAHTLADCQEMTRAAREAKGIFASGLEGRSNPVYKLAHKFFKTDAVRDLVSMRAQTVLKSAWVSGSLSDTVNNWRLDPAVSLGLAGEMGVLQYDVFHWFREKYPVSVQGAGSIRFHNDGRKVHDTIWAVLNWDDGATLSYEASLANSYEGRYELIRGSNSAIKLGWTHGWMFKEADAPTQGWEVYANRQQFHKDEGITLIADATKLASQGKLKDGVGLPESSLHYCLYDFFKSVSEGKPPVASADEGLRATTVAIAAHEAVNSGQTRKIDPEALRGV